jgi:ATP adenylyltransferase
VDFLWSPWRYGYVTGQPERRGCIFCEIGATADDDAAGLIHRGRHCYVVLNRFPYTSGHLMIVPFLHAATLEECSSEILQETIELARRAEVNLREIYRCHGLNLGWNIGECAGAGVAGHIHLHVLPRWPGDVNFMTSVAETRVLPEDRAHSLEKLRGASWTL